MFFNDGAEKRCPTPQKLGHRQSLCKSRQIFSTVPKNRELHGLFTLKKFSVMTNSGQPRLISVTSRCAFGWSTFSPSISQRYCCGVSSRASLSLRGH